MAIKTRIEEDLHKALRQANKERLEVLRMLKTALTFKEKEAGKEITEEEAVGVLQKEKKQRIEAAGEYRRGEREDLAQKEEKEAKIIDEYLPAQLSDDKLKKIVEQTIQEVQAKGRDDFGKVMGKVMGKVKGQADGQKVKEFVWQLLS